MQETRPLSRFRLKVDTGCNLPPIAGRIATPEYLDPVLPAALALPVPAGLMRPAVPCQVEELAAVQVGHLELPAEVVEQARALAEQEPPAPIAAPVSIPLSLEPSAPAAPALHRELQPVAFAQTGPAIPDAQVKLLRPRLVAGPNPNVTNGEGRASAAAPTPAAAAPKPKITIRAAEPAPPKPARPAVPRPATMVARSNAQPVEREVPDLRPAPAPPPSAEPKVIPIRKPETPIAKTPADIESELRSLILSAEPPPKSPVPKIGIAAAALLVIGGGGWFVFRDTGAKREAPAQAAAVIDTAVPIAPLGGGGWTSNWGTGAACNKGKQIALYRPSMAISDYRIELVGQIERKAMGWVFRASDPENYYVMKLEQIKPGTDPVVALVKYAVIDGKETTHTQIMLPGRATLTTMFKVRTDVKGNKFTTYVQDEPVDYWTDDRMKLGGAGLYVDAGERALMKTTSFSALR